MKKTDKGIKVITFRRWSRKGYSLFRVIRQTVRIAVLAIIYHKAAAQPPSALVNTPIDTTSVSTSVELEEIEIGAYRAPAVFPEAARVITVITAQELQYMPATSLPEIFRHLQGADIRQRGPEGIQADLSLRGGTFDQTMILLNGINITDPQTGHHSLHIPLPFSAIERIEVLEGPASRIYGPNAFSGAVNIVTKQGRSNSLTASYTAGSHHFSDADLSGTLKSGRFSQTFSAARKSSSGYIPNTDFETRSLYLRSAGSFDQGLVDFQFGYSEKAFGANAFYTPRFPDQFEKTRTMFTSLKWNGASSIHLTPAVYWRRHHDRFELFRYEQPGWYAGHNYHMTDIFGMTLNAWLETIAGKTAVGSEIRNENIWSTVLGDPLKTPVKAPGEDALFNKYKSRTGFSVYLEHSYKLNNLSLNAGLLAQRSTELGTTWKLYPGIDLSWLFLPGWKVYATAGKSLRLPTFTDLYYSGPTNKGNPELEPEEVTYMETGIKLQKKGVIAHASFYLQNGDNLIDWIKMPGEEIWQTKNHTEIRSSGFQAQVRLNINDLTGRDGLMSTISAGYNTTRLTKENSELISYYTLDNLRHKLNFGLLHKLPLRFYSQWMAGYQDRNGTFSAYSNGTSRETPYEPFWLIDWKLSRQYPKFDIHLTINNIFDKTYIDLGNIPQPGRWIKAGISVKPGSER